MIGWYPCHSCYPWLNPETRKVYRFTDSCSPPFASVAALPLPVTRGKMGFIRGPVG